MYDAAGEVKHENNSRGCANRLTRKKVNLRGDFKFKPPPKKSVGKKVSEDQLGSNEKITNGDFVVPTRVLQMREDVEEKTNNKWDNAHRVQRRLPHPPIQRISAFQAMTLPGEAKILYDYIMKYETSPFATWLIETLQKSDIRRLRVAVRGMDVNEFQMYLKHWRAYQGYVEMVEDTSKYYKHGAQNRDPTAAEKENREKLRIRPDPDGQIYKTIRDKTGTTARNLTAIVIDALWYLSRMADGTYEYDGREACRRGERLYQATEIITEGEYKEWEGEHGHCNLVKFLNEHGYVGNCGDRAENIKRKLDKKEISGKKYEGYNDQNVKFDHSFVLVSQIEKDIGSPPETKDVAYRCCGYDSDYTTPFKERGRWFILDSWIQKENSDSAVSDFKGSGYVFDPADQSAFEEWCWLVNETGY